MFFIGQLDTDYVTRQTFYQGLKITTDIHIGYNPIIFTGTGMIELQKILNE